MSQEIRSVYPTNGNVAKFQHQAKGRFIQPQNQHSLLFCTCRSNLLSQSVGQVHDVTSSSLHVFHLTNMVHLSNSETFWQLQNCQRRRVRGGDNNEVMGTEQDGSQQSFCPNLPLSMVCSWGFWRHGSPNWVTLGTLQPSMTMIIKFWGESRVQVNSHWPRWWCKDDAPASWKFWGT